ncbi:MAG: dehydrogenase subunit [Anaerocolumna sp.]|jgi:NADH:ubiquinone oxidoreductase subunit E|nr:dehydrogenase subunit [Anaerocolumna sp.]
MVITICIGSSCHLKGSREIVHILRDLIKEHKLENKVELNGSFCIGECMKGVCVKLNDKLYSLTPEKTESFFMNEVLTPQSIE